MKLLEASGAVVVAARCLPPVLELKAVFARDAGDGFGSARSRGRDCFGEVCLLALETADGLVLKQLIGINMSGGGGVRSMRVFASNSI